MGVGMMPRYTTVHFQEIAEKLAESRYVEVQTVSNFDMMFKKHNDRYSSELFWKAFNEHFCAKWKEEPFNRV
jgi:hypothetical protein